MPWAVLALTAVGGALRFTALGAESLWYDEAWTHDVVTGGLRHAFERPLRDVHPPLYFLVTHVWVRLGDTDWMLRAPSALLGTLTVPFVYGLGAILAGRRVGLVAAALFAVSTFQIYYAQEARMYALLGLATALAAVGAAWIVVHPAEAARPVPLRPWRAGAPGLAAREACLAWGALALGTAAALLTHHTAVFFVAALGLGPLGAWIAGPRAARAGLLRNAALAVAGVVVLWGWMVPAVLSQTAEVAGAYWVPAPTVGSVLGSFAQVIGGPTGGGAAWRAGAVGVFAVLGLVGLRRRKLRALWLVALVAAAPLGLLVASGLLRPIFMTRPLIVAAAPLYVLVGVGLLALRPRALRGVAALALLGVALAALPTYYASQKKPRWAELGRRVAGEVRPGDAVLVLPGWAARPFRRYYGPWEAHPAERILLGPEAYPEAAERLAPYRRLFVMGAHLWLDPEAERLVESLGIGRPRLERSDYGTPEDEVILVVYGERSAEE